MLSSRGQVAQILQLCNPRHNQDTALRRIGTEVATSTTQSTKHYAVTESHGPAGNRCALSRSNSLRNILVPFFLFFFLESYRSTQSSFFRVLFFLPSSSFSYDKRTILLSPGSGPDRRAGRLRRSCCPGTCLRSFSASLRLPFLPPPSGGLRPRPPPQSAGARVRRGWARRAPACARPAVGLSCCPAGNAAQ